MVMSGPFYTARSVTMGPMGTATLTVFGGTGFLGQHVASRALAEGWAVRVAARRPGPRAVAGDAGSATPLAVDVRDPDAVQRAVEGAAAVVNAVSLYVAGRSASFHGIHVDAAGRVAQAAKSAGARLVHVSGIGVDRCSPSPYVRARALGEARVRDVYPQSVILRPSVLFSDEDAFLTAVTGLVRRLPVIPLFGSGECRIQPVHVDDAARAVVAAAGRDDAPGATYELGGPHVFTYRELLQAVAGRLGKRPKLLPIPFGLWRPLALLVAPLPEPPITRDQIELMRRDNIVRTEKGFVDLGIDPGSLSGVLESVTTS